MKRLPTSMIAARGDPRGTIVLLALVGALAVPSALRAQQGGPSIAELERLLQERESTIATLSARLARLEAVGDSLVRAKRRAEPGGAPYERISNQILENSSQIDPIQRSLRQQHEEARDLRQTLYDRYQAAVAETNQRIEELRRQGRTPQNSPELSRLIALLPRYIEGRERYVAAVEEQQCAPYQPDLVLYATDSPAQLRYKEALARDLMDQIDKCIAGIEGQIRRIAQKERIKEEAERLREESRLWEDDRAASDVNRIDQILRGDARTRPTSENPFDDPQAHMQALRRRRLELIDRREQYDTRARQFAQRLREF